MSDAGHAKAAAAAAAAAASAPSSLSLPFAAVRRAADAALASIVVEGGGKGPRGQQQDEAVKLARPTHDLLNACLSDFVLQLAQRANGRSIAQGKRNVALPMVKEALSEMCPPPPPPAAASAAAATKKSSKKRGRAAPQGQKEEREEEKKGKQEEQKKGHKAVKDGKGGKVDVKEGRAKQKKKRKVTAEEEAALIAEQEAMFAAAAERHRGQG